MAPKPELSYTDNGDGTGGTVRLLVFSGSYSGTYTIHAYRFTGLTNGAWEEVGSITNSGNLPVSGAWGPIDFMAIRPPNPSLGDDTVIVGPLRARITDGLDSLHERCIRSLRDFILQLNLQQLPENPALHIMVKLGAKLEKALQEGIQRAGEPPAVVFYIPQAPKVVVFDNQYDSITYPVIIAYLCKRGHEVIKGLPETLDYREKVLRAINACNMLDIPEVHTTQVNPGVISDVGRWMDGYDASVMTINFTSEQQTGGLDE